MFSKYATLLAFAASAIAGAIQPGTYRITNVATQSTVRANEAYSPIYVSSTKEDSPFELWDVKESKDGSYTLNNVGLGTTGAAFYYYSGAVVRTGYSAAPFSIELAGDSEYLIKVPHEDYLWSVELPSSEDIKLRSADGSAKQRWTFTSYTPE